MRTPVGRRILWMLAAVVPGFFFASLVSGQERDEYGEVHQTVARISSIEGSASFSRGDDPDNWQAADRNVPMTIGDRVYTGDRSRLEIQVHGGDFIRLGAQSDLSALNLTDDTKQFSVQGGVASFQVLRLDENEVFEIDTPNSAITIDAPGDYRVDVDRDGNTRVAVRRGRATAAAGGGQVRLKSGDEMDIDGIDEPRYDIVALRGVDAWDRWIDQRQGRLGRTKSLQYVSQDVVGVDDLDDYGRWESIPEYGRVWTPTVVAADWLPYRVGHWIWQDPWGWTWVSAEPWGWAPYHYGRWVTSSSRWYWVPVAPSVRAVSYSPALVAFVGGGPGWSASVTIGGGGFVGWFPLGPRDQVAPWWTRRSAVNVNVTNVTYVNRTYVTVVNQNTFVSGGIVTNAVVRDNTVMRQVVAAPVVRGPLPVVPTAASLRVAARAGLPAPLRPPTKVMERAVVARVAPPPAPPTFQAKLTVIRENRGAPVAPVDAAKIAVENRGRPQATTLVRPVAAEPGKITLAPRGKAAENPAAARPEPVAPVRGRAQATVEHPVAPVPATSSTAPAPPASARERETGPPASREVAPRPASPPPPAAQPAPERGREQQLERAAPPPQQPTPVVGRSQPQNDQKQNDQKESWRNRERPTEAAPRSAPAQTQQPPPPQPAERSRENRVTPEAATKPAAQQARPESEQGRQKPVQPPPVRDSRPAEERLAPTPSREVRPQPQERQVQRTAPPPARESRPAEEHPAAPPSREARPQPQPERQVQRPTPQKPEQKSQEKEKDKKKKDEKKDDNKDDRERKPE
jgi:hypothetical protein